MLADAVTFFGAESPESPRLGRVIILILGDVGSKSLCDAEVVDDAVDEERVDSGRS